MKPNLLRLLVALALTLGVGTAYGKECEGIAFPDQVPIEQGTLQLNGLGLRQATLFKVDVYVAALYLPQTSSDAEAILALDAPKQIVLHFVRDVDREDLIEGWDEGFRNNVTGVSAALRPRIESFKGMMADIKAGEQLGLRYTPGAGTQVSVKGTAQGTIAGADFARALYAIWLGQNPPNPDLKAGLLGGTCG